MKELIREIREFAGTSQIEMADWLGVTFATVNRWENGHTVPNKLAQHGIYDFCRAHGVPLAEMTVRKFEDEAAQFNAKQGRMLLFHGSKFGIKGDIRPVSRRQCDFGRGFYMGTDVRQALCRVAEFKEPVIYLVELDYAKLKRCEIRPDMDWAMLVACNRGRMDYVEGTEFYEKYSSMTESCDLVIGSIANDRMYYVLDNFFQGNITDSALVESMKTLDLGKQYVAISEEACKKIKIISRHKLEIIEQLALRDVSQQLRTDGIQQANYICRKFRREGRFFDEIISDEQK